MVIPFTQLRQTVEKKAHWVAILLLLIFFGRLLTTATAKSVTFDEVLHILHGVMYWQHTPLYSVVQNPPLVNSIIGMPVSLALRPLLPLDWPVWETQNWLNVSKAFIWETNANGLQMIFVGRLGIMWLALLFGSLVYRWSKQLFRSSLAGLLALFLFTFDPNVLAHAHLATTDIGSAFFLALAGYLIWRYWSQPVTDDGRWRWLAYGLAGVAVGLALAAKFSGVILFPALGLMALYRWFWGRRVWADLVRSGLEVVGWGMMGILVFLMIYRFDFAPLYQDYVWQRDHQLYGHSAFLLGELRTTGWWYYFPLVLTIKTPVATLVLFLLTGLLLLKNKLWQWEIWWPLLLAGGIFAAGLTSRVNIGYRYLLPMLPMLFVVVGQWVTRPYLLPKRTTAVLLTFLLLFIGVESMRYHPDYLAYFNQIAGGPDNGWRFVVDSNIDWGQDIQPLGVYMAERGLETVQIAFLGTADLEAYGVQAELVPAWPARRENVFLDAFYPDAPAPDIYVISATQLQGPYLQDKQRFRWFRTQEPTDKVGYSLFVYDVLPVGPAVSTAVSGIGIGHIAPDDYQEAFQSNDVRVAWYDARTSLLWPGGHPRGVNTAVWTAVGDGHWPQHPALQALYPPPENRFPRLGIRSPEAELHYTLFRWDNRLSDQRQQNLPPIQQNFYWTTAPILSSFDWVKATPTNQALFDDTFELIGYEIVSPATPTLGQPLELLSYWRIQQTPPHDAKIFLHLVNEAGEVAAQHDGLDVRVAALQAGDEFVQLHTIWTNDLEVGEYGLQLGLYDPDNPAMRLRLNQLHDQADRILLQTLLFTKE